MMHLNKAFIKTSLFFITLGLLPNAPLLSEELVKKAPPKFIISYPSLTHHKLVSGDRVVGKTSTAWAMERDRLKFVEESEMRLTLFKKPQKILTTLTVYTNEKIQIQNFIFNMKTYEAEITIEARRLGSVMKMQVKQAKNTQFKEINIQEPMLLGPTIKPYLLMLGFPQKESKYEANLLEPSALTTIPIALGAFTFGKTGLSLILPISEVT